jgi:hypothetical protein
MLEAFAISFSKLVQILDQVKVHKDFNIRAPRKISPAADLCESRS